ncbi:Tetratricopeptide-like helical [Penicillium occitanis (nom. inval.)]|nr:Tetratricopeptide-like helical [Penicillium occitanis (nom. inval.)]PCH05189.1 hypothetical protein PENOC_029710 [Penicillium occitanis (nom. inval.)]
MLLRASKAYEEILGLQDSKTLDALEYLGTTYRQMGKLQEAESTYTRVGCINTKAGDIYAAALDSYKVVLGPDHSSTQQVLSNLAAARILQERYPEAETMLIELFQQMEACYGLKSVRVLAPRLKIITPLNKEIEIDEHRDQHSRIRHDLLTNVAGRVTPLIAARKWKLCTPYELYPDEARLLGRNYNKGEGMFIRLRSAIDEYLSLPRIIDIMLHELARVEHRNHGPEFIALWE